MEPRETIFTRLTQAGGRVYVRSALNPALWLCAIVGTPCLMILGVNPDPHPAVVWILVAVVGTAIIGFLTLLAFDRDRLHSEDYLIRRQTLDIIEEKASKKAIDASLVSGIFPDEFLTLPPGDRDKGAKS